MSRKKYSDTAVVGKQGFKHFGISEVSCSLYGNSPEDIVKVDLEIHEDQSVLSFDEQKNSGEADYWGWMDKDSDKFSLIFPQRFLLNMAFPYGIESSEELGKGNAYRLKVTAQ